MAVTTNTIVGVFDDAATAQRAADELRQRGIDSGNIHVTSSSEYASDAARGGSGLSGDYPQESSGGGITGFFKRLFGSHRDVSHQHHYSEAVRRGGTVVAVRAADHEQDTVTEVMERYDPIDIDERVEGWRTQGYTGYDAPSDLALGEEREIPVVEEELEVDKRQVRRGGVRVFRNTHDEPVEEQVHLREERVRVDRRPADRLATEADLRDADEVIEFTETVEEPVVRKRKRVVEEVVVGKDVHDRTETVRDTVRRSDVEVQRTDDYDHRDDFRRDFESRYRSAGDARYEEYEPAYRYGYDVANDKRYRGRDWEDVEDTLKTDYLRTHPTSSWDRARGAVRYGWEKMTNKRP